MPALPKFFINNSVVMISSRMEEGLYLVPTAFVNRIIRSVLATAQTRHPVDLIAFVVQPNHLHLILRVLTPEDVPQFVGYVKQELAHRINRLLGRRKRTIWARGYDSPVILDKAKTLTQIVYVMLNPVGDNIIPEAELYPGVSSFQMFESQVFTKESIYIPRNEVPKLKNPAAPWRETAEIIAHFDRLAQEPSVIEVTLTLSPYAWRHCFTETEALSEQEAREMMQEALIKGRAKIEEQRKESNKTSFQSPSELVRRSMITAYLPKKFGKRMLCHSSVKDLRVVFIACIKRAFAEARLVFKEWGKGVFINPFPPGFFLPGRAPMASIPSIALLIAP